MIAREALGGDAPLPMADGTPVTGFPRGEDGVLSVTDLDQPSLAAITARGPGVPALPRDGFARRNTSRYDDV